MSILLHHLEATTTAAHIAETASQQDFLAAQQGLSTQVQCPKALTKWAGMWCVATMWYPRLFSILTCNLCPSDVTPAMSNRVWLVLPGLVQQPMPMGSNSDFDTHSQLAAMLCAESHLGRCSLLRHVHRHPWQGGIPSRGLIVAMG